MNGAATYEEMVDRIIRLRGDKVSPKGDFVIGCVMIKAPVFFDKAEWVAPPSDWAKTGIQQGKTCSLEQGEGARVFKECVERALAADRYWNVDRVAEKATRYGTPMLVRPRLGQGLFSLAVRDAYGSACAVTREHSSPVLEAAHIVPFGRGGVHSVENGILLRSDLHRLFDRGYVTVTPDYEFRVGGRLREEFNNGRSYYSFDGEKIAIPKVESWRPSRESLEWHMTEIFRG
jgi:putative restriction endonuclease